MPAHVSPPPTTSPAPCHTPPPRHPPAVHDFGFFRFDPARLQYLAPAEVPLAPDAAAVGLEIRVVGNDSGEKVRGRGAGVLARAMPGGRRGGSAA